jgi:hypothetical protein
VEFLNSVLRYCSIPEAGAASGMQDCVMAHYDRKRAEWVARLTGPAREEAERPIEQHVASQVILQHFGYLPAAVQSDGVYGPTTRAAIKAWQNANGRPVTGFISNADAAALGRVDDPRTATARPIRVEQQPHADAATRFLVAPIADSGKQTNERASNEIFGGESGDNANTSLFLIVIGGVVIVGSFYLYIKKKKAHRRSEAVNWLSQNLYHGTVIKLFCGPSPHLNLHEGEELLSVFPETTLTESRAVRTSRGSYGGPSFRITKGP